MSRTSLTRVGFDLRSNVFAHGQLYVPLSRAQNRHSTMCLLPPTVTHVLNGFPHTANECRLLSLCWSCYKRHYKKQVTASFVFLSCAIISHLKTYTHNMVNLPWAWRRRMWVLRPSAPNTWRSNSSSDSSRTSPDTLAPALITPTSILSLE